MASAELSNVSCNVCGQSGGLKLQKIHRFSAPLVIIGWLLLLPSFLGVSCGACGLFATGTAATSSNQEMKTSYERRLKEIEGVSVDQVAAISAMPVPDRAKLRNLGLSDAQITSVENAHDTHLAGRAGAAIGGGLIGGASMMIIIGSFIGGVFGWILILRKRVIACSSCKGIHSEAI